MQNTSFFQSSDSVIKTRTVNVFRKEIKLKNYFASAWICPGCAEENSSDKDICAFCGTKRLW